MDRADWHLRSRLATLRTVLSSWVVTERARWILWAPVALALGIVTYFSLPAEPTAEFSIGVALCGLIATGIAVEAIRHGRSTLLPAAATALVALGFVAAVLRTADVAAPALPPTERSSDLVTGLDGRVLDLEALPEGLRLLIAVRRIDGLAADRTPARIRLRWTRPAATAVWPSPGAEVRVRARLRVPDPPLMPGGFDAARAFWFQRIGALGDVLDLAILPPTGASDWLGRVDLAIARARLAVAGAIRAALPDDRGAVAHGVVLGEQAGIPEDVLQAMRDSGLAHLLSVSGLHLSLVGATLLLLVRRGLCLWPRLVLAFPAHKIAAVVALIGTFGFTLLADAPIPTQRAFLAFALVLLAILADRHPVSMRLVCWSAFVVLLLQPESLLGASFQMSFAAVLALVAVAEAQRPAQRDRGLVPGIGRYVAALAITSLVAGIATGPIGAYHFNRVAVYGVLANLIGVPLTGVLVMPGALAGLALWPFGVQDWGFAVMGLGITGVIETARLVASLPGAAYTVPALGTGGCVVAAIGFVWLTLWRHRPRWAGAPVIVLGLAVAAGAPLPDLYLAPDGRLVGARDDSGRLYLSGGITGGLRGRAWARSVGEAAVTRWPATGFGGGRRDREDPTADPAPDVVSLPDRQLACDGEGCVFRRGAHAVALVRRLDAVALDCRRAAVIILPEGVPRAAVGRLLDGCPPDLTILDTHDLRRSRGLAIRLDGTSPQLQSVADQQGDRPWSPAPHPQ